MGMISVRVVAVWILTRIKEQPDDFSLSVLRGQRQGTVPGIGISKWKQASGILQSSKARSRGQVVHRRASLRERLSGAEISEDESSEKRRLPFCASAFERGTTLDQQFGQSPLQTGFGRVT